MRPLRYSINVTLDGCVDHRAIIANEDIHRHATNMLTRADALIFGRVTYQLMEDGWRNPWPAGTMPEWMEPFARMINAKKKFVVSSKLQQLDWNAELLRGDLKTSIEQLKAEPGDSLYVGGVTLPLALTEMGLIDEYEFLISPRIAGHGRTLFAGLTQHLDLTLVNREEYNGGQVALRYVPKR